jgi:hypothetical protein
LPTNPLFIWDPQHYSDARANDASFTTIIMLNSSTPLASLEHYPFDTYSADVYLYGAENTTGTVNYIGIKVDDSEGISVYVPFILKNSPIQLKKLCTTWTTVASL